MTDEDRTTRRTFTKGIATASLLGTVSLAGCSGGGGGTGGGSGGEGGDGSDGGDDSGGGSKPSFDGWLSEVSNYDGVEDRTDTDTTTVKVGTQANGGAYGYGPAALKVSKGTTVKFEWTGQGAQHNVVDQDGAFESDLYQKAGVHFEHTFSSTGTYKYFCQPHEALGMKGVIVVE